MAKDIFQENINTVPKDGNPQVTRVQFDKNDIGARKSHTGGALKKNENSIKHV